MAIKLKQKKQLNNRSSFEPRWVSFVEKLVWTPWYLFGTAQGHRRFPSCCHLQMKAAEVDPVRSRSCSSTDLVTTWPHQGVWYGTLVEHWNAKLCTQKAMKTDWIFTCFLPSTNFYWYCNWPTSFDRSWRRNWIASRVMIIVVFKKLQYFVATFHLLVAFINTTHCIGPWRPHVATATEVFLVLDKRFPLIAYGKLIISNWTMMLSKVSFPITYNIICSHEARFLCVQLV